MQSSLGWDEFENDPVVAVAFSGWLWTVVEDMAVMAAAPGAVVFSSRQKKFEVELCLKSIGQSCPKAWLG